jgi:phage FluMu gp28-like protein
VSSGSKKSSAKTGRTLRVTPLDLLLPYQRAWVQDSARFKIWLKSRQIGGSLAAAFEVVADAIETGGDWVILSAGERQALEFMDKVNRAASIFCDAVSYSSGREYRPEIQKSQLRFPNGARVLALPANPSTARGYSANLILDEFAFHENPEEIWRAVYPIISNPLRGALKLRVISTPAGRNNKYFDLWEHAPAFSRHQTTVYDAVAQGLALNIDELRANLADSDGWAQEFECQFMEHSSQVFPADVVKACESTDASLDASADQFSTDLRPRPVLFVGIDVGRKRDLTVAWTLERIHGGTLVTREVLVLDRVPFPQQEAILLPRVMAAAFTAIDATGIGGPVSEHLAASLDDTRLEGVTFTGDRKRELFERLKKALQARAVALPAAAVIRDDLGSMQRIVSPGGTIRYTAARTADGHADRSTALALAVHAAQRNPSVAPGAFAAARFPTGLRPRHRPALTRYRSAWSR